MSFNYELSSHTRFIVTIFWLMCSYTVPIVTGMPPRTMHMSELAPILEGIQIVTVAKGMLLEKSLATTTFQVSYTNTGSKTRTNVYFLLNSTDYEHLALFSYREGIRPKVEVKTSKFNQLTRRDPNTLIRTTYRMYEVALSTPLKSGDNIAITYTMVTTNKLNAYPLELELNVLPMYVFEDTLNMLSLYVVREQTSSYTFKKSQMISHTPHKSAGDIAIDVGGAKNQLTYTIKREVAAFHSSPFWVHISSPAAYTSTTLLHRKVYVSEYADVEFVESHTIYNRANKLIGEFSRDRVAKSKVKSAHIVNTILFQLPKDSYNYYYRDMVGNISTSTLVDAINLRQMHVTPRFPLMGGWNTEFTIKYKRPAEKVIKKQSNDIDATREFKVNLLGACNDVISIEHLILEIILPERAKAVKFTIPTSADVNITQYNTYYYMDMAGRVTLRIEAHNLISLQDVKLEMVYSYNSIYLLMKPYYASLGFFIVLFTVSILSRVRILGSHDNNKHTNKVHDLLDYLQQYDDLCLIQLESLRKLLSVVDSYKIKSIQKKSFDNKFSILLSTINADMIALNNYYAHLCDVFPDCKVDLDKKLSLFKQDLELINKYHGLVVKLRDGDIVENAFSKSYKDIDNQIKCNKEVINQLFA